MLSGSIDFDVEDKAGYKTEEYTSPVDGRTYYRQVLVESTGFVFNRVWRAIKREVLYMWGNGFVNFMDVDRAWMIFTRMKEGPFALMDKVGLDVIFHSCGNVTAIVDQLESAGLPDVVRFSAEKALGAQAAAQLSDDAWREGVSL